MTEMPISEIEQGHKDEWLLIRVTETDGNGDPTRGELLFHSADRDKHDRFMLDYPGDDFLMTTYTGKPKGSPSHPC